MAALLTLVHCFLVCPRDLSWDRSASHATASHLVQSVNSTVYHITSMPTTHRSTCHSLQVTEIKVEKLEACVKDIREWMLSNFLKLNDSKTEFLILGTPQLSAKLPKNISITIGDEIVSPSKTARNIGAIFYSNLQMSDHVSSICRSCYIHIRDIGKIRPHLTQDATEKNCSCFHFIKVRLPQFSSNRTT